MPLLMGLLFREVSDIFAPRTGRPAAVPLPGDLLGAAEGISVTELGERLGMTSRAAASS